MHCTNRSRRHLGRAVAALAAAGASLLFSAAADAVTRTWTAGSGNWSNGADWSPTGVPTSGDVAEIVNDDATNRTVNYDYSGNAVTLNSLLLLNSGTASDTFSMPGNSLSATNEWVGFDPTNDVSGGATFAQTGGENSISDSLTIGGTSSGDYNITSANATLAVGGNIQVGVNSYGGGVFSESAGSVTVDGTISAIPYAGTQINLSGGTLTVGGISPNDPGVLFFTGGTLHFTNELDVGYFTSTPFLVNFSVTSGDNLVVDQGLYVGGSSSGTGPYAGNYEGSLTESGGSIDVSGPLEIYSGGLFGPNSCQMTFSAGTLAVGSLDTDGAPSDFTWTGGTLQLTDQVLDFNSSTSDSDASLGNSLTLGSDQSLIVNNYEWLNGSDATVSQGSGSTNSCTALYLGNTDVSTTYDLNAGATLTTTLDAGYQYVGYQGGDGSTDAFQQSGGTNSSNDLYIGYSDSAIGVYTQTAGSNTVAGNIYLAYSGQTLGTYSLSGGSVTAQNVYVGGTNANFAGGKGTLNISGSGQMTVSGTLMIYGNGLGSAMNISGGSLNVVGNTVNGQHHTNWRDESVGSGHGLWKHLAGRFLGSIGQHDSAVHRPTQRDHQQHG